MLGGQTRSGAAPLAASSSSSSLPSAKQQTTLSAPVGTGPEVAVISAEEARIEREITRASVEHFAVFAHAEEANRKADAGVKDALERASKLSTSLTNLATQTARVNEVGQTWRHDNQMASNAVTQYQKLTAFLDAPGTLDDCLRNDMFHEALLIIDHVAVSCQQVGSVGFVQRLLAEVYATLERDIVDVVLPRLASPLSVASAVKITTFFRRLGVDEVSLRQLFLKKRGEYIDGLVREAEQTTAPYSFLFKYTKIYKVDVSEVIMRYSACFSSPANPLGEPFCDPLVPWCHEQARRFVDAFNTTLKRITSGAELASVIEQCINCSATTSKVELDVFPLLGTSILDRVVSLFQAQIQSATSSYAASMGSFAWKMPHSYTPETDSSSSRGKLEDADAERKGPPVELVHWLPLAYALNGIISACNDIRKCVVPGAALRCISCVAALVNAMANDLHGVRRIVQSMEQSERQVFNYYVDAFVNGFVPHVYHCIGKLFASTPVAKATLREQIEERIEPLRRIVVVPPPPPPPPSAQDSTAPPVAETKTNVGQTSATDEATHNPVPPVDAHSVSAASNASPRLSNSQEVHAPHHTQEQLQRQAVVPAHAPPVPVPMAASNSVAPRETVPPIQSSSAGYGAQPTTRFHSAAPPAETSRLPPASQPPSSAGHVMPTQPQHVDPAPTFVAPRAQAPAVPIPAAAPVSHAPSQPTQQYTQGHVPQTQWSQPQQPSPSHAPPQQRSVPSMDVASENPWADSATTTQAEAVNPFAANHSQYSSQFQYQQQQPQQQQQQPSFVERRTLAFNPAAAAAKKKSA